MKRWYVVQVYAGYEELARASILKGIEERGMQEAFGDILVPSAKAQGILGVIVDEGDRQLFPGYILVEMEASPEAFRLVQTSPRVVKFLGGRDPVALAAREVDRVLAQIRGDVVVVTERQRTFEVESEVEIAGGPFAGFNGIVKSVNEESEKLVVMVSIFGRMTPVELGFDQVKQ